MRSTIPFFGLVLALFCIGIHGERFNIPDEDSVILIKPDQLVVMPKLELEKQLVKEAGAAERKELLKTPGFKETVEEMTREEVKEEREKWQAREEEKEEEKEKPRRADMFKTYVAVGVIRLVFDNATEPFTLFHDAEHQRSRVDYGSGKVRTLQLGGHANRMYRIEFPTTEAPSDRAFCIEMRGTKEKPVKPMAAIPDLNRFERSGQEFLEESKTNLDKWTYELNDEKRGGLKHWFKLLTETETRKPVKLDVVTRNKAGKTVDHYAVDFKYYFPTTLSDDIFVKPVEIECRSIAGLSEVEEEKHRGSERKEVDEERLHMNPMVSFVDFDQHLAFDHAVENLFQNFRRRFERKYENDEEFEARRTAFYHNYRFINMANRMALSYKLAVNHLADRTNDELRRLLATRGAPCPKDAAMFDAHEHNIRGFDRKLIPDSIDYRNLGAVTPVQDQGECGSDWAIAAKSVVESALFLRTNRLVKLSGQQLLDCSHEQGNRDCSGGELCHSYEYVLKNGLSSASAYGRLTNKKGECRKDVPISAKIKKWIRVQPNDLHQLQKAIALNGPVAANMDASHKSFIFYKSGIYTEPNCRNKAEETSHAVVIVGYGNLNGRDYLLAKNSFGREWGLNGYTLLDPNACGVLSSPTFVDL